LVDQEDGRPGRVGLERQEQRPLEQEALVEDVVGEARPALGSPLAAELRQADLEHLAPVVPLVERGRGVEPLVALESDEPPFERLGQNLRDLGLADSGLPFEEQRAPELQGQENRGREARVGNVPARGEQLARFLDVPRQVQRQRQAWTARRAITVARCARYSGLASLPERTSAVDTAPSGTASGVKSAPSAASRPGTRNAFEPAPVTATRTPPPVFATITPTRAYFDAGWANLA